MKSIEQRPATRTTSDTPTRIISAGVYEPDPSIIGLAAEAACINSKVINYRFVKSESVVLSGIEEGVKSELESKSTSKIFSDNSRIEEKIELGLIDSG